MAEISPRVTASRISRGTMAWGTFPANVPSLLRDLPILFAAFALFYAVLSMTHYWMTPVGAATVINLSPSALPKYAMLSVLRIAAAYICSLGFTLVYGYIAAYNTRAEKFMLPLLDTLQSIPVLSFLPAVMLAMVSLFPTKQLGVELGSILLIFTGQVWNMTFSFYSSLKNIPSEMREVAEVYHWSWWQRFTQMEFPYAIIGLVWNSMMSVAGGWFFLMACEMFTLGNRDLRLPGLGSYLQTAANAGNTRAIFWGMGVMIGIIVAIDQLVWRPVIAWAEKFKFEQVESTDAPQSPVLDFLRSSKILPFAARYTVRPASEWLTLRFARRRAADKLNEKPARIWPWVSRLILAVAFVGLLYAFSKMISLLTQVTGEELRGVFVGAGATLLRVALTLFLAGLWTIPAGVMIGLKPKLSAIAQPIVQVAASVPATALFPIILLLLIRVGGGLGVGSIILLLLGTQWYLLFNVIAGATAIPTDLKEVCSVYRFRRNDRWRGLLLPGIFPFLITGFVTASGGAWNASIIAEYFHFRGTTYMTTGLGAVISNATDTGNFRVLLAASFQIWSRVCSLDAGRPSR